MALGFGGVGQFRPDDSRQPGVRITLGAVPGLPATPAGPTFDPYDFNAAEATPGAMANGYTATRLGYRGLQGPISGTRTIVGMTRDGQPISASARPPSAMLRQQRLDASRAASRGRPNTEEGLWFTDPDSGLPTWQPPQEAPVTGNPRRTALQRVLDGESPEAVLVDPALTGGRLDRWDVNGNETLKAALASDLSTEEVAKALALPVSTVDRLRQGLAGPSNNEQPVQVPLIRGFPEGRRPEGLGLVDAQNPSVDAFLGRFGLQTPESLASAQREQVYRDILAASEVGPSWDDEGVSRDQAQLMVDMAQEARNQGLEVSPSDLRAQARMLLAEQQGERFPIDAATGLPSDVPLAQRGQAGLDRQENLAMNADPGGFVGIDPTTTDLRQRNTSAPNEYGVVRVPVLDATGQIAGYRTIDPTQVAEIVTADPDATFTSDTFDEITLGRLVQQASDANKTPVITAGGLQAAQQAGRYVPLIGAQDDPKAPVGFLYRSEARPRGLGVDQLGDLLSGTVVINDRNQQPVPAADLALRARMAELAGRPAGEPGTLTVTGADGRPIARLITQIRDGRYTGSLEVQQAQPVFKSSATTTVDRAIPFTDRERYDAAGNRSSAEVAPQAETLYRLGQAVNRDYTQLRADLAADLGVQRQQVVSGDPSRVVNLAKLRDVLDAGYAIAPRGSGADAALSLEELAAMGQAVRGQKPGAVPLETPFLEVINPAGKAVQRLGFQRDKGGSYTGALAPLVTAEVGPAPFVGGLGIDQQGGKDAGRYSGLRQSAEKNAAPNAVARMDAVINELGKGAFMANPSVVNGDQYVADMLIRGEITPDQVATIYPAGSYGRKTLQQEVLTRSGGNTRLTFLDDQGPDLAPRGPSGMSPMEFYRGATAEPVAPRQVSQTPAQGDGSLERALAQQLFGPVNREPAQTRSMRPMATQAMRQPDPSQTSGNPSGGRSTIGQQILNALREENLEAAPAAQPSVARELPVVDGSVRQVAPGRRRGPYAGAPYYRSLG